MENERLDEILGKFHEELKHAESLSEDERRSLNHIASDIRQLLKSEGDKREGAEQYNGQLRQMILQFEANHPDLTLSMGRIADALAKIGV
ncbi:MAG TPA: DUF4404 family protein [Blastocatellia bacterium]|nr:DUF4404 family protein [Blastocatellia bacterium]